MIVKEILAVDEPNQVAVPIVAKTSEASLSTQTMEMLLKTVHVVFEARALSPVWSLSTKITSPEAVARAIAPAKVVLAAAQEVPAPLVPASDT